MASNKRIDYSKLSLADVIESVTGNCSSFFELDRFGKSSVLSFISQHELNFRIFESIWFDVLTGAFHVAEYSLQKRDLLDTRDFGSFRELYEYVGGRIYERSCFYGYAFADEEIKEFNLDVEKLKSESLIDYDIDSYTFEKLISLRKEKEQERIEASKGMKKWIDKCKPAATAEALAKQVRQFSLRFGPWKESVLCSLLLMKHSKAMRAAVIDYVCSNDVYCGISFADVLFLYGEKAGRYVIDHFHGAPSKYTHRQRINLFENMLEAYAKKSLKVTRRIGFDENFQLYYCKDNYETERGWDSARAFYFEVLNEFVSFVKGDLRGGDFSKAPEDPRAFKKCIIDEATRLPLPSDYSQYRLIKEYGGGLFVCKQEWLDENGTLVLEDKHSFSHFFDFAHFLKGDLRNADLLMCDSLERIAGMPGLCWDGAKVRGAAAKKLGLPFEATQRSFNEPKSFEATRKNELATKNYYLIQRPADEPSFRGVSYITDIHLLHRFEAFGCETKEDDEYVLRSIALSVKSHSTSVNLIGGDTSSDPAVFRSFVKTLGGIKGASDYFFTLGNHELWMFPDLSLNDIYDYYRKELSAQGMHLVQNNIYYLESPLFHEITEQELENIDQKELRNKLRAAELIIFGGLGFSGENQEFNAKNGIYAFALTREEEIKESEKFYRLYRKVVEALHGKSVIVFTHMPFEDWSKDRTREKGFIYVSGHNHNNYYRDDGETRIYEDNQIGYEGNEVSMKQIETELGYDWFADYPDGIHEITDSDYYSFYRGIGEYISFGRQYEKLYVVKRENTYMFLMRSLKGSLLVLNGGAVKKAGDHPLEYFYENIAKYAASIKQFLAGYNARILQVAEEVKRIGGAGTIHGCIVDIDFLNHIYLNPIDGTLTPYFAYSMVDKTVYENIPSLLNARLPKLLKNLREQVAPTGGSRQLTVIDPQVPISNKTVYVTDTSMYRASRIMKALQFTSRYSVIRVWNDDIVSLETENGGRLIVSDIMGLNPSSLPTQGSIGKNTSGNE